MAGALVLTAASGVGAANPVGWTKINACVNKTTNVVKIRTHRYSLASLCSPAERQMTWDITGPTGATGATGAAGPAGPAGPAGAAGAAGPAGATGAAGPAGADGADGATGPAGADGATGPAGADGADGATGPAGADGATGPAGADGADGATGPAGADGADGATGPAGADGAGAAGYLQVAGDVSADTEAAKTVTATCTGGRNVVGGGFEFSSVSDSTVSVLASYPSSDTVWTVSASDMTGGGDHSYAIRAYAICATVAP